MKPTIDDEATIHIGVVLSRALREAMDEMLGEHPRRSHIIMVALTHAAVQAEVRGRKLSRTNAEHRADFHNLIDAIMNMEEKVNEVLK
jgi:hypothetical protein